MTTKIDYDSRTDEARCQHSDLWGSVCPTCWEATPWLIESYGMTYRYTGGSMMDDDPHVKVSPKTPKVEHVYTMTLQVGDLLHGYSARPAKMGAAPVLLSDGTFGITKSTGVQVRIVEQKVYVTRAADVKG